MVAFPIGVLIWVSVSSAQMPVSSGLLATSSKCQAPQRNGEQWMKVVGIAWRRDRELPNGQIVWSHIFNLLIKAKFKRRIKWEQGSSLYMCVYPGPQMDFRLMAHRHCSRDSPVFLDLLWSNPIPSILSRSTYNSPLSDPTNYFPYPCPTVTYLFFHSAPASAKPCHQPWSYYLPQTPSSVVPNPSTSTSPMGCCWAQHSVYLFPQPGPGIVIYTSMSELMHCHYVLDLFRSHLDRSVGCCNVYLS